MRVFIIGLVLLTAAGCTERNPDVCCIDAADCERLGAEAPLPCPDGLTCRGNECIAERCAFARECNAASPFCDEAAGTCAVTCQTDAQCPGFGGAAAALYCEAGTCVECRDSAQCGPTAPVCGDSGQCRTCTAHAECGSGICTDDGTCAALEDIAYASPGGASTGECMATSPCTLERAVSLMPQRPYVLLETGTFTVAAPLMLRGLLSIVSRDPSTTIRTSAAGSVMAVQASSEITLDGLNVTGATSTAQPYGNGVECGSPGDGTPGPRVLRLRRTRVHGNAYNGVSGFGCSLYAHSSSFDSNWRAGIALVDSVALVERSTATENGAAGISVDFAQATLLNNIVTRNTGAGVDVFAGSGPTRVEFNTIADNGSGLAGAVSPGASGTVRNNIIARNGASNLSCNSKCQVEDNIILGTNIASLMFRSPDVAPYDYHLLPGSAAIDAAVGGDLLIDIDGDLRPSGAARDVGADEFVP